VLAEAAPFLLFGTALYLLARPALALLHELLILLAAELLGQLASLGARAALTGQIPLDPIYTGTLFLLLSDVKVAGVAVARPLGAALHAAWPTIFAPPDLVADDSWASAVVQPGASVIARGLAGLSGDVALLTFGLLATKVGLSSRWRVATKPASVGARCWRRCVARPRWLAVFGALLQAHIVVNHLVDDPLSLGDLEATGLTYGFSVLFSGPAAERPRLTTLLASLPEPARDGLLGLAAVILAYGLALGLLLGPLLAWRLLRRAGERASERAKKAHARALPLPPSLAPRRAAGLAAFALAVAVSPLGSLIEANTRYLDDPPEPEELAERPPPGEAVRASTALPDPTEAPPPAPAPTHGRSRRASAATGQPVVVSGSGYSYTYRVGGSRQAIRGMGYNPTYARLPADERAARYDRDFAAMHQAGVNTVLGWVTDEFDRLLLDRAQAHGLGVILPYDLDPELDYTNPAVRDAVAQDVLDWVERYRDHPTLRMWGLGNEVLHKLIHPSWMKLRGDPLLEARAAAFATFYIDLIDEVHRIDPDHPVVYRDAEDTYLPRLREVLNKGGVRRPWFVYGINIYTPRLAEVIANWPNQGLDAALLISEFGPGGAGPRDRPRGYRDMWAMVRAQPSRVLGGAPYVWSTRGPEEVDRIFGLIDADGRAVDGSLATIGRLFRGEAAGDLLPAPDAPGPDPCDERVARIFQQTVRELQTSPRTTAFQAGASSSVMGPLDNLPPDPIRPADLRFERADDSPLPDRPGEAGSGAEWWVTWTPPSRPGDELGLLIRERSGLLDVAYVYHGPASPSASGRAC
jgi:hypothetical protein